jgi:dihydroorotase (multifunctional complex type)
VIVTPGPAAGAAVVDCRGLWVLPGAIDAHVHSRDPGFPEKEDWTTLTSAAAVGGVTTVLDMPNTVPAVDTAEVFAAKASIAGSRALVDFGLWGLVRSSSTPEAIAGLLAAGAVGLKAFLGNAYHRGRRAVTYTVALDDPELEAPPGYDAIARLGPELSRRGGLLAVHAEDPDVLRHRARHLAAYADVLLARPAEAEAAAIAATGRLAGAHGFRLHLVHVSSAEGLAAATAAKRHQAADVSIETCPQYLWATADDYRRVGNALRINPPVREQSDRGALRAALVAGELDTVGTDHAPHTDAEKFAVDLDHCHPGSPGVQTLLLSQLQLGLDLGVVEGAIRAVTGNVAERFRLAAKGAIRPGADADLVLVDPAGRTVATAESMLSRQKHGVLEGMAFDFAINQVYARGELVAEGGRVVADPGRGRLVRPGS